LQKKPNKTYQVFKKTCFQPCDVLLLAALDDDYDSSCDQDSCTTSDSENDPLSGVLNYLGRPMANKKKFQQGEWVQSLCCTCCLVGVIRRARCMHRLKFLVPFAELEFIIIIIISGKHH